MVNRQINWKKYLIVFIITSLLFGSAVYFSKYFDRERLAELKTAQDKISVDLLSSETEFAMLQQSSCQDENNSFLNAQLNDIQSKIQYSAKTIGENDPEVINLKQYYTVLEIKDYLLMKEINDRCKLNGTFIVYISSQKNCSTDCDNETLVLNTLAQQYPTLQIYSFDYDTDLDAMRALIATYKVPETFPSLIINGKLYTGFKTLEDIEKLIPEVTNPPAPVSSSKPKTKPSTDKTTTSSQEILVPVDSTNSNDTN